MNRFCLLLVALLPVAESEGSIQLIDPPKEGRQFETLRFRFAQNLPLENPFDLETNRVELVILRPDFTRAVLSFFYDGTDADSVQQWEARYAPDQPGEYRLSVRFNDSVQCRLELEVKPHDADHHGGLRLADRAGVFALESGEPFRGIGMNLCWADDYEYYFRKMQAAGINVTRVWLCPWHLSFEWRETGLGRYSLASARRLDALLDLADRYGIYIILCMDYHGVAPKGMGFFRENRWLANPYNRINGGPCIDAADLFTNPDAMALMKRKYKYIVSRFGHSPRIAAWEFINEADLMAGHAIPMTRWHVAMAEYIHTVDVHHRLVSTSATRRYMEKLVDAFRSPAIDFVMYHDYNSTDIAPHFTDFHETAVEFYQKPVVLGEFGVEFRGGDRTFKIDSQHVGLHNGIWAGWFCETPIIPMSWWWDSYIDKYDLWSEFASLSHFVSALTLHPDHLSFRTLPPGRPAAGSAPPQQQPECMVRCISSGDGYALWFKNDEYKWSLVGEGKEPEVIGGFTQVVTDLAPGSYVVRWYDPQSGQFDPKPIEGRTTDDGVLEISVPAFARDLACIILRHQ